MVEVGWAGPSEPSSGVPRLSDEVGRTCGVEGCHDRSDRGENRNTLDVRDLCGRQVGMVEEVLPPARWSR
jgi:hypothetical protein